MERGNVLFEYNLNKLNERGDYEDKDDCLKIAEVVRVEQIRLYRPGDSRCNEHYEDYRKAHSRCLIELFGNSEERTDSQKA